MDQPLTKHGRAMFFLIAGLIVFVPGAVSFLYVLQSAPDLYALDTGIYFMGSLGITFIGLNMIAEAFHTEH